MNYEFDCNTPIYIQLVEQIKILIISGKVKEGEKLPSVRDLALQMKVNPNTMQKALTELEDIKLIYTERTNGKYVTTDKKRIEIYKDKYVKDLTEKYILNMKTIGLTEESIINYLKLLEEKNGIIRNS